MLKDIITDEYAVESQPAFVVVSREELHILKMTLKQERLHGRTWSMQELERRLGKKHEWIRQHILDVPEFKKILDANNGGFVKYPSVKGESWAFQARKMADFLEEYFPLIHEDKKIAVGG